MSRPHLAAMLVRWRTRAGLTQYRLALLADVARPNLSHDEHGERTPGIGTLERLIRALAADPIRRDRMRLQAWRALAGADAEEAER